MQILKSLSLQIFDKYVTEGSITQMTWSVSLRDLVETYDTLNIFKIPVQWQLGEKWHLSFQSAESLLWKRKGNFHSSKGFEYILK